MGSAQRFMNQKIPLLVITGPTASGKTKISIDVAKALNGEIVSADSMQIYRGMDIATAKPAESEMEGIPHHLIGFLEAGTPFSVALYADRAHEAIRDIHRRGKLPILCGGTGLYIQAVVDNLQFTEEPKDPALRAALHEQAEREGGQALLEELRAVDPETAGRLHVGNLGRIIRALELFKATGILMSEQIKNSTAVPSPYDPCCMLALDFTSRAALYDRIDRRVDGMLSAGLLEEAQSVLEGGEMPTAFQAIGYKELMPYFQGGKPLEECADHLKQETRRYAKRQLTWLRRDERVQWIYPDRFETYQDFFAHAMEIISRGFKKSQ